MPTHVYAQKWNRNRNKEINHKLIYLTLPILQEMFRGHPSKTSDQKLRTTKIGYNFSTIYLMRHTFKYTRFSTHPPRQYHETCNLLKKTIKILWVVATNTITWFTSQNTFELIYETCCTITNIIFIKLLNN